MNSPENADPKGIRRALRAPLGLPADPVGRAQWRVSQVYWLCLVGILSWFVLRLLGVDATAPPVHPYLFVGVILFAFFNLGLRSWVAIQRNRGNDKPYKRLAMWFTATDLALIATGLRATGAAGSALWVIVFVLVVAETVLGTRRDSRIIVLGAILTLIAGTIPLPLSTITDGYALDTAWRLGILIAVSVATRRLRENSDTKNQELAALRAELALANERSLLSREVHDGVGNSLAATVLHLEVAARLREKAQPGDEAVGLLREEAQVLRDAMTTVRDWAFTTRLWQAGDSLSGSESGAPPSHVLTQEIARLGRRTGLTMEVSGADLLDSLSPSTRLTILRITQEALTNAAKYAEGASCARVALLREGRRIRLTIADDGCGFDSQNAGAGIGMVSMHERAQGAGGTFEIDTAPGHGTRIQIQLPA